MEGQEGRTLEELLPWGDTPLRRGLATREVVPGTQTGIQWLRGARPGNTVRCDIYLDAVEFRTQGWLYELKSPRGTPLLEVFQQELGLDAIMQARFLVYREMLKAADSAVPAPSLAGHYAKLRGSSVAGQMLEGAGVGAVGGWIGAGVGALSGAIRGVSGEFQRLLEGLTWLVRLAVILTWYGPYLLGLVNLVMLGLFPFVMLWALIPGAQFEPLAHYFAALLFTSSVPLWWALVDQGARLAAMQTPQIGAAGSVLAEITSWMASGLWVASVTALGILVIPVIVGCMFFAAFRVVGSLWRGGL